ncbi:MAG: hypothetical protein JWP00_4897 [Chloroflexi bacterium]|jgi:hypothetical protein|nr:hypothetical protein [Chloroflexota bacterium]
MNSQLANNKGFRVALGSFMVAGLLVIMLLASLSTSWGVAYGQTAGPTTVDPGQNATTTQPAAVGNSGKAPTVAPSAVNDFNAAPVGVVPGLPNTGTGSPQADADNGWKFIALALLLANMLIAGLVMSRFSKSKTR